MKQLLNWMIATILICGASVISSCTSNLDSPVAPVEPDLNIAEKIIGRWIQAEVDGQPAVTNRKNITTFYSPTLATVSTSRITPQAAVWSNNQEFDVKIDGNLVTLTRQDDETTSLRNEYLISSITDTEMVCLFKHVTSKNGRESGPSDQTIRYTKVSADYTEAILGMWEGRSTGEEGSEFDDGENHRWKFLDDGTFNYFQKVDGQWQMSVDEYSEYFVEGYLLCTRWKNAGEGNQENREWWEVESIENGVMKWKALRQREDGTTYTATFEMVKVTE